MRYKVLMVYDEDSIWFCKNEVSFLEEHFFIAGSLSRNLPEIRGARKAPIPKVKCNVCM